MHYLLLLLVALIVLGSLARLSLIDKPAKPLTPEGWILNGVVFNGVFIWLLIDKFVQLNS